MIKKKFFAFLSWIKILFFMVHHYDRDRKELYDALDRLTAQSNRLNDFIDQFNKHLVVDADISPSPKEASMIIVSGRYRDRDYIKVFHLRSEDFNFIIDRLISLRQQHKMRYIDAPVEMRAVIKNKFDMGF